MVKTLVSETTRDPEFARFRFLTGCQASNGHTIICGEVNAKNAYGGYAGYTPLWVRIDGKELIAARFAADIADTVRTRCNEVKSGITTIAPNAKMKCFGVLVRY